MGCKDEIQVQTGSLLVFYTIEKKDRYGVPYWTNWTQVRLQTSSKIKGIRIIHNRIFTYKLTDQGVVYPPTQDLYFASSKITVTGNHSLKNHHTKLTNKD